MMSFLTESPRGYLAKLSRVVTVVLLAVSSIRLTANLRFLRSARHRSAQSPRQLPRVSVLVPARNEAATIVSCITSLLHQRYPNMEVLVLDDGSTDGTGQQLDALKAQYPQLTVVHATGDPPSGWNGKSYACHCLAEHATGDWLLFTDADTHHAAASVERGIAQALALDARLLSAFPYQRTKTWSERIIVSFIVDFMPLLVFDLDAMWRGRSRRVLATGQYLLAHARTYRTLGGHAAIAGALVDDFALAQCFRAAGYTVAVVDGTSMLECRMYRGFHDVWDGFSKNLLGAVVPSLIPPLRRNLAVALWAPLFAWCYACLFVLPFFHLAFGERRVLPGIQVCWLFLLRGLAGRQIGRPLEEALATPLAAWGVMAIGMGSVYRHWRGRPISWKGRLYSG